MTLSSQQEWPSQAWLDTKMNSLCVNTLGNKALSDSETFLEKPENVYQPSSNMTELERRERWGEEWQINADVQSLNWFKGVMNCLFFLFCYLMSTYNVIKIFTSKNSLTAYILHRWTVVAPGIFCWRCLGLTVQGGVQTKRLNWEKAMYA